MNSVVALLGRLQGVLGKTFLSAGLLPSLVLLLGCFWFCGGESRVRSLFVEMTFRPVESDASKEAKSEITVPTTSSAEQSRAGESHTATSTSQIIGMIAYRTTILLGVALVFFAARHMTLRFFTALPFAPPLRWMLTWYEDWRWLRAKRREEQASWRMTISIWPLGEVIGDKRIEPFDEPSPAVLPPDIVAADLSLAVDDRFVVKEWAKIRHEFPPSRKVRRALFRGLETVYVHVAQHPSDRQELDEWRELLTNAAHTNASTYSRLQQLLKHALSLASRDQVGATTALNRFPAPDWMMPTRLGNALASLDDYASTRYGIDTTALWIRLWGLVPKEERNGIANAQAVIESSINMCVAMSLLALFVGIYGPVGTAWWKWNGWMPLLRTIGFFVGAIVLARICYAGAVFAVGAYSERVIRCIDLHRLKLFSAAGFEVPRIVKEERELFRELSLFYNDGNTKVLEDWKLSVSENKKKSKTKSKTAAAGTIEFPS